jgi:hypothetical protein
MSLCSLDRDPAEHDQGIIGERGCRLASGLPLAEAIQRALVLIRDVVDAPVRPVWRTAPYEILGYSKPVGRVSLGDDR